MAGTANSEPGRLAGNQNALTFLKGGLFLVIAGFLAWRMVTLGLSEHYSLQSDPTAPAKALAWHPANPNALYYRGRQLIDGDPAQAEALLRQAAHANPANSRIFAALALFREQQGEIAKAVELMEIANRLGAKRSDVQWDLAAFWLRQNRLERAIEPLSLVLESQPQRRERLFPGLLQIVEDPQNRRELTKALKDSPTWWTPFFRYAINNIRNPDTAYALYQLIVASGRQPSDDERRRYIAWLQQQNLWQEAYTVWSESLTPLQQEVKGLNYDGGFKFPLSNEGFGWHAPRIAGVDVETLSTYGAKGGKAVRVTFRGLRTRFQHLYQYLLLLPGSYELTGMVRVDNLETAKGVRWIVSCAAGKAKTLAASEPFQGVSEWRQFKVTLTIPAQGCSAQQLRLQLMGDAGLDFEAIGSVWFDELAINRV